MSVVLPSRLPFAGSAQAAPTNRLKLLPKLLSQFVPVWKSVLVVPFQPLLVWAKALPAVMTSPSAVSAPNERTKNGRDEAFKQGEGRCLGAAGARVNRGF